MSLSCLNAAHSFKFALFCSWKGSAKTLHAPVAADWENVGISLNDNKRFDPILLSVSAAAAVLFDRNMRCDWMMEMAASLWLLVLVERYQWCGRLWSHVISLPVIPLLCHVTLLPRVRLSPDLSTTKQRMTCLCVKLSFSLHIISTILNTLLSKCIFSLFPSFETPHHSSSGFCLHLLCHFFIFWLCLDLSVA